MKWSDKKPYLYGMLAGFGAISLSVLFFFLLYRYQGFGDAIHSLVGILAPFIYGLAIAYLLKPVCNTYDRFLTRHLPDSWQKAVTPISVTMAMVTALLTVYLLLIMIIPQLVNSVATLMTTMPDKITQFRSWLDATFSQNAALSSYIDSSYSSLSEAVDGWVTNTLKPYLTDMLNGLGMGVWNAVIGFKNLLIGLIVAVYLLASRHKYSRQAKLVLYSIARRSFADTIVEDLHYADRMFEGFINGKLLDSLIIGILCYIVSVIVKFPNALLVSAIVGVTNIIPFFGPFIGAIPATLLILIEDPIKAFWFVIFIIILQQLDGNVIGPKILGNTTGLSSFWVLFSILLFGGLWGFVGMIIGVPLSAVIYDILCKFILRGLHRNQCDDMLQQYNRRFGAPPDAGSKPAPEPLWQKLSRRLHPAPADDPAADTGEPADGAQPPEDGAQGQ